MEVEITYIAKDGRRFADPIQCEEYEKTVGVLKDSVAGLILELDKHNENDYITGVVFIRHRKDGTSTVYTRATACVDDLLESFVNIKDLTVEQRYLTATFGELKHALQQEEDKDDWVQYAIVYSSNIEFNRPGIMVCHNPMVWKD